MKSSETIEKCRKELAALYELKYQLDQEETQIVPGDKLDQVIQQINTLIEGDYSKAVFDNYSESRPALIRDFTGEEVQWLDAFGDSFEKTTRGQRHSLVGLVEGGGKYRFKQITLEGQ